MDNCKALPRQPQYFSSLLILILLGVIDSIKYIFVNVYIRACQVLSNLQQISCTHRQDSMSLLLHACKVLSNVTRYWC